jgi:hypothetical protein
VPNRAVHLQWSGGAGGIVVAFGAHGLPPKFFWAEVLGGTAGGGAAGLLPDVLEPAFTPMHRGVAHSVTALGLLTQIPAVQAREHCRAQAMAWRNYAASLPVGCAEHTHAETKAWWWHFAAGACVAAPVGYAVHLLLDARTPCGLPLMFR